MWKVKSKNGPKKYKKGTKNEVKFSANIDKFGQSLTRKGLRIDQIWAKHWTKMNEKCIVHMVYEWSLRGRFFHPISLSSMRKNKGFYVSFRWNFILWQVSRFLISSKAGFNLPWKIDPFLALIDVKNSKICDVYRPFMESEYYLSSGK